MKKYLLAISILISVNGWSQTILSNAKETLERNNIRAIINTDGTMFNNIDLGANPGFEAPKDGGSYSIFSGGLWIGGYSSSTLHLAGMSYGLTGNDFWPGPISDSTYYTSGDSVWNRLWKITSEEIEFHRWNWWQTNYNTPEVITNWPAHGDINKGQAEDLAPFEDRNNNGIYEPHLGDLPIIKGDEAVYFIFNDHRESHTETGGKSLKIEVHGMTYSYDCSSSSALNNTIFLDYSIFNRSMSSYTDTYLGMFMDMDLGGNVDDYIGSDVQRSSFYTYNGDNDDTDFQGVQGYGTKPPSQACTFIKGPLQDNDAIDNSTGIGAGESINGWGFSDGIIDNERRGMDRFLYFNNAGAGCCSDPSTAIEYYNFMNGIWKDGNQMVYGGTGHPNTGGSTPARYMYPGTTDPLHFGTNGIDPGYPAPSGWTEYAETNTPGDRKGVGTTGPFTFEAGSVEEITIAFTFAQSDTGGALGSVQLMQQYLDEIRTMYQADTTPCGYGVFSGLDEETLKQVKLDIELYPNPAKEQIFIKHDLDNPRYELFDMYGKLISNESLKNNSIDVSNLATGVYLLKIENETIRFLKE